MKNYNGKKLLKHTIIAKNKVACYIHLNMLLSFMIEIYNGPHKLWIFKNLWHAKSY